MISFICNNEKIVSGSSPALDVLTWLRDVQGLKGTKEGCREGDCGACTVVIGKPTKKGINYSAVCSCLLPIGEINGCHLVTVEGLAMSDNMTPMQQAFYDEAASQCGFCTPGMMMSLTGFLLSHSEISIPNAIESLDGNICRCTGYVAVKRAITKTLTAIPKSYASMARIEMLIEQKHIPEYFKFIPKMLAELPEIPKSKTDILVAGGTDLYVHSSKTLANQEITFLSNSIDLNYIKKENGRIKLGGTTTFSQLRNSTLINELFPKLKDFLAKVSSTQIRKRATVAGNIVNASPIADIAIIFLALGADVTVNNRKIPLEIFYLGYKQLDMQPKEILTEISFQIPEKGAILSSLKVSKREYLDIASVNSSFLFKINKNKIIYAKGAAGGIAPTPLLLRKTSEYLTNRIISENTIKEACLIAGNEISPISDVRGSKEYKTALLKAQIEAHLTRGIKQ